MGNIFSGGGGKRVRWRFKNFSRLLHGQENNCRTPTCEYGGYKWCVRISLHDIGTESGYLGIFLVLDHASSLPPGVVIHTEFKLHLLDQLHNKLRVYKAKGDFGSKQEAWGFMNIMSLKDLQKHTNGFLVNDSCIFEVDFAKVNTQKAASSGIQSSIPNIPFASKYAWRIDKFSQLQGLKTSFGNFSVGGHMWNLELYPDEKNNRLGLYLKLTSTSTLPARSELSVVFLFWLEDQIHGDHTWFMGMGSFGKTISTPEWGCELIDSSPNEFSVRGGCKICKAIPPSALGWEFRLSDLLDPSKGFLVKDACIIRVSVSVREVCSN